MKAIASAVFLVAVSVTMLPTSSAILAQGPEQQGCCSRHGGVCGCSNGRTKCCDGAMSPSCTCVAPDGVSL